MTQCLDTAISGRGRLLMVAGEAGVGKTSLVRRFIESARQRGAAILQGACYEGDWQPPYGPWAEALYDYLAALEPEQLKGTLADSADTLATLAPPIRALLPDTEAPAELGLEQARRRLYDAVVQFLLAEAHQQPLVIVLEDLHWADSDSLELLHHTSRFLARVPLLVVGVYRDPEVSLREPHSLLDTLGAMQHSAEVHLLRLGGLSHAEINQYLLFTAGASASAELVGAVSRQTRGNPLYMRQLIEHLGEERSLAGRGVDWDGDLSALGVPAGLQQVLHHRLSRLHETTSDLLRLVSAFRAGFQFGDLLALAPSDEDQLLDSLDEAIEAGFLTSDGADPPGFAFAHDIVRHALYDELSPPRRARRHRRIAEALEWLYAGREGQRSAELAWQYHASRSLPGFEKGIAHALVAASQAREANAPRRSVTYLRMARDLARAGAVDDELYGEILRELALAEAEAMLWDDLPASVEQAIDRGCADREACIAFCTKATLTMKGVGAPTSQWEPIRRQGLALVGSRRDLTWARLAVMAPRFVPLSDAGLRVSRDVPLDPMALEIVEREGNEDERLRCFDPNDTQSLKVVEELMATYQLLRRPRAILRALEIITRELVWRKGRLHEGLRYAHEYLEAARRYGDINAQAEAYTAMAQVHIQMGQFAQGLEMQLQMEAQREKLGEEARIQFLTRAMRGSLAYWTGIGWPEAGEALIAYAEERELGRHHSAVVATTFACLCYLRLGREREARARLDALVEVISAHPDQLYGQTAYVGMLGTIAWEMGYAEPAGIVLQQAERLLAAGLRSGPLVIPEITLGRMSALLGDLEATRGQYAALQERADKEGLPSVRAMGHYDLALALVRADSDDRSEIQGLLESALVDFEALGMPYWAERAREQLAALAAAPSRAPALPDGLTPREVEVLALLAQGDTNQEIADELVISIHTVERHVANIYVKIDARNRAEATLYALSHGLSSAGSPEPL